MFLDNCLMCGREFEPNRHDLFTCSHCNGNAEEQILREESELKEKDDSENKGEVSEKGEKD